VWMMPPMPSASPKQVFPPVVQHHAILQHGDGGLFTSLVRATSKPMSWFCHWPSGRWLLLSASSPAVAAVRRAPPGLGPCFVRIGGIASSQGVDLHFIHAILIITPLLPRGPGLLLATRTFARACEPKCSW